MAAANLGNLIRDIAGASQGKPDSKLRMIRDAFCLVAPQYAPHIKAVENVAGRLGVRITSDGLDLSGLRQTLAGQDPGGVDLPWVPFVHRIHGLKSGVALILGPRGSGKTTLAVKLAEAWRRRHGYDAIGVNLYPDDTRPWMAWKSIKVFADGVEQLSEALEAGQTPPPEICRRIIVVDEASLSLHPGGARKGILAVERMIRQARHLNWLIVVVAHLTVDLPVQLAWCDCTFVKEPAGDEYALDRDTSAQLWQDAAAAYRELRRTGLRGHPKQAWVYAHAPALGYKGMVHSGIAGAEDPWQPDQVKTMEPEGQP